MTTKREIPNDAFGLCPECKQPGFIFSQEHSDWFRCDKDRVKWPSDYELDWQGQQTEEERRRAQEEFANYRTVEPYRYPLPLAERMRAFFRRAAWHIAALLRQIAERLDGRRASMFQSTRADGDDEIPF